MFYLCHSCGPKLAELNSSSASVMDAKQDQCILYFKGLKDSSIMQTQGHFRTKLCRLTHARRTTLCTPLLCTPFNVSECFTCCFANLMCFTRMFYRYRSVEQAQMQHTRLLLPEGMFPTQSNFNSLE